MLDEVHESGRVVAYFTRSAKVNGRRGLSANLLMSLSEIWALEGGCDHVCILGGNVSVVVLRPRLQGFERIARARRAASTRMPGIVHSATPMAFPAHTVADGNKSVTARVQLPDNSRHMLTEFESGAAT